MPAPVAPRRGRPRLTLEELQARVARYCARFRVRPNDDGLPPFPTGKRETPQHREWLLVYKAHQRLSRRLRGRCERCDEPAEDGSIFCARHRDEGRTSETVGPAALCPLCGTAAEAPGGSGETHEDCRQLALLASRVGPERLERIRAQIWPSRPARRRRAGTPD